MKASIVYHGYCIDGFTAAWLAWHYATDHGYETVELVPAKYGDSVPACVDHDVWVLDFSFRPADLVDLCARANQVTWLDHHASAIDAWDQWLATTTIGLPANLKLDLDNDRSGALITWDWFHAPGAPESKIVQCVDDRDRWVWKQPGSAEVFAALTSRPQTIEAWDEAFAVGFDAIVAEGAAIARYRERLIETHVANAYRWKVAGHWVHVANCPYAIGSEVAGRLAELHPDEPFAAYWLFDGALQQWGLRSRGDGGADVAVIAQGLGGGGHRHASGFRVPFTRHGRLAVAHGSLERGDQGEG